ncbi:MAG: hypothetical protein M2R45_01648 [Verrucomicrobia subdivision 3 bacterium]|nr:hypothetical protein [Limisphaerales bacterium]MCS1412799.1 hypothetical protein [Limisphaerales bacterium]
MMILGSHVPNKRDATQKSALVMRPKPSLGGWKESDLKMSVDANLIPNQCHDPDAPSFNLAHIRTLQQQPRF